MTIGICQDAYCEYPKAEEAPIAQWVDGTWMCDGCLEVREENAEWIRQNQGDFDYPLD